MGPISIINIGWDQNSGHIVAPKFPLEWLSTTVGKVGTLVSFLIVYRHIKFNPDILIDFYGGLVPAETFIYRTYIVHFQLTQSD